MAENEDSTEELGRSLASWIRTIKKLPIGLITVMMTLSSLSTMGIFAWQDYQEPAEIHFIPAAPTATPSPTATPEPINVFINGEVQAPGIYTLPFDARVQDLLDIAGGFTVDAFIDVVNLAQPLVDGMHVYIPAIGDEQVIVPLVSTPPSTTKSDSESAGGLINLNRASKAELETLPGVGPSTAQKILDHREDNGPFSIIEDVMNVSGIGPAKFESMSEFITVDG